MSTWTPKNKPARLGSDWQAPDSAGSTPYAPIASATPGTSKTNGAVPSASMSAQTGKSLPSATTANGAGDRKLSDSHKRRVKERGLDPSLCEQLGVWSPDAKTIAFDYRVNGAVHNTKLRRGKGNMPWSESGKGLVLWNVDSLRADPVPDEFVIVTEGEFDAAACVQSGFNRVVSVPNGAQANAGGFKYLFEHGEQLHPDLEKFGTFVLAFDADKKGLAARDAIAVRLGDERCRTVQFPAGCKDANDVLRLKGAEALADCIHAARPMWTDEIATIDDVADPGEEERYKIGIPELDHHGFRITLPALWVILGPYSSGKSVLLRQILCNLWGLYGWRCLLTAFEERVKPRYQRDLRRHFIDRANIPDKPWSDEEIAAADDQIRRGFIFLQRARGKPLDTTRLLDRIEYAVKVYGVAVVVIDPANEVEMRTERGQLKTDLIGEFLMNLKDLAADYKLLVIVVGHTVPVKTERKQARGELLTLYDGEDTRHWGGKSDIGWVMWRRPSKRGLGASLLHLARTKDYETMGRPTLAELELDKGLGRFRVTRLGYDKVVPVDEEIAE